MDNRGRWRGVHSRAVVRSGIRNWLGHSFVVNTKARATKKGRVNNFQMRPFFVASCLCVFVFTRTWGSLNPPRIPLPERLRAEPFSTDSANREGSIRPIPSLSQYKSSRHSPASPSQDRQSVARSCRECSDIPR